jgi:hypothetical protein
LIWDAATNFSRLAKAAWVSVALVLASSPQAAPLPGENPKKVIPLSQGEVATAWIGISDNGLYMLRLALRRDGTGAGAYMFLDNEPVVFQLSWQYEKGRIQVKVTAPGAAPDLAGGLIGNVASVMRLEANGPDWRIRFSLREEELLERRWRRLVDLMPE